jgi:hypothetical protein
MTIFKSSGVCLNDAGALVHALQAAELNPLIKQID